MQFLQLYRFSPLVFLKCSQSKRNSEQGAALNSDCSLGKVSFGSFISVKPVADPERSASLSPIHTLQLRFEFRAKHPVERLEPRLGSDLFQGARRVDGHSCHAASQDVLVVVLDLADFRFDFLLRLHTNRYAATWSVTPGRAQCSGLVHSLSM